MAPLTVTSRISSLTRSPGAWWSSSRTLTRTTTWVTGGSRCTRCSRLRASPVPTDATRGPPPP
eukprot:8835819-Heterocapsa_arctica.AAC.1